MSHHQLHVHALIAANGQSKTIISTILELCHAYCCAHTAQCPFVYRNADLTPLINSIFLLTQNLSHYPNNKQVNVMPQFFKKVQAKEQL